MQAFLFFFFFINTPKKNHSGVARLCKALVFVVEIHEKSAREQDRADKIHQCQIQRCRGAVCQQRDGTGTGKLVAQPLLSASRLRCLPQIQGFAAFILGDKNMSGW